VKKTIVVACDHAGFELKPCVIEAIQDFGDDVIDVGTYSSASADFPDFAQLGAHKILSGEAQAGVFLCGSGVGVCMAANKIQGIYASVCHDTYSAHQGVEHDGMNVLCLGARIIGSEVARELVTAFLGAEFNHKPNQIRRFEKIKRIEAGDLYLENRLKALKEAGQSVWLSHINRRQMKDEKLTERINNGEICGLTTTFSNICSDVLHMDDYSSAFTAMIMDGWDSRQIFQKLSVDDVRQATSLFRENYISSGGSDGLVTIEMDPQLANDYAKSLAEAKQIWTAVNRPNLMISVPATAAGIETTRQLTREGINTNQTLIFSEKRFRQAVDAYLEGLEARHAEGKPIDKVQSILSVHIAEIDTKVDAVLAERPASGMEEFLAKIKNKAALTICRRIYNQITEFNQSERMQKMVEAGAKPLRILWDVLYPNPCTSPTFYSDALIGNQTILSVHQDTLAAICESGRVSSSLPVNNIEIEKAFADFQQAGIDFQKILEIIEEESMESYCQAFEAMLNQLDQKSDLVKKSLGVLYSPVLETYKKLESDSIVPRIFSKDPTVWTFDTQAYPEIRNRLGWLDAHQLIAKNMIEYKAIAASLKADGIRKVLLMGMGGSSLAPEVMALTFPEADGMELQIIDSTDPGQVLQADADHPLHETVYIVSSKSGGTAEVQAFLDYFYHKAVQALGDRAGAHFIAITDPGTLLERMAKEMNFRNVVLADPSIGGRFSALSAFGVLPAVLIGIAPEKVLEQASRMAKICAPSNPVASNEGAALGVYMGTAALSGRDKVTILVDPNMDAFGSWLEQLIAESSGKTGKGIVPVDIEPKLNPADYPADRAFVYIKSSGEQQSFVNQLIEAGQPVLTIKMNDLTELFAEFYRWEIAISVACSILGVNAFDQPNVQDSKNRTVAKINDYKEKGALSELPVTWEINGIQAYFSSESESMRKAESAAELINAFASTAVQGTDYIGINAYLPRNDQTMAALQQLREKILKTSGCATTLGFGPRFQHSTGQLHKGGANNGLFIQIVADSVQDAEIPNEGMTFAILERAQALGDFEALIAKERRAIRLNLGSKRIEDLF